MKTVVTTVVLALLVLVLPGCVVPSSHYMPMAPLYQNTTLPTDQAVPGDGTIGRRTGEASVESILAVISWGDSSIATAARQGNIRQLKTIDQEVFNVLGIYTRQTTIVTGD